jgi:hypothetical protein
LLEASKRVIDAKMGKVLNLVEGSNERDNILRNTVAFILKFLVE